MNIQTRDIQEIQTTCPYCGVGCGLRVESSASGARIQGDPDHPANLGRLCSKGSALGETLDLTGRLLHPMLRGRRVDWDHALGQVARAFRRAIRRYGPDSVAFYVSGQLLTEDYYVANKLMKGFIGSGNIDTNSRLCMSSSVAGHQRTFGEDLVPGNYEDLELADLVIIVGGNSAWCHPVLFQRILAAREQRPDMKLVVIDPRRTATAEVSDLHLPLKPGSDVELFNGLFRYLLERGHVSHSYLERHTEGYKATRDACRASSLERVADRCDLDKEKLTRFYQLFTDTERTVTLYSQGVNQSSAGTDKVNAILNVHLLTGRIGLPGAGPFSLTGQPNAMGGREVGGLATSLAAHMGFSEAEVDRVGRFWGSNRVARKPGLKAVDLFQAMEAGKIKAVWIMGTNPAVSMPDGNAVRRALSVCEFVAVSDCVLDTDTNRHADVLLPAAAWGEKNGTASNSERRISRQRAFLPLPGDARPDWWIISQVARRMGYRSAFDYWVPVDIFTEHARLSAYENQGERVFNIGALSDLSAAAYDALQPLQWPITENAAEGTARLIPPHRPLRFIPVEARPPLSAVDMNFPLVLNSGRIRDHWHTLTRTGASPCLSRHLAEPFLAVHPDDAETLNLLEGHLAQVETRGGKFRGRIIQDTGQRRGEIFAPMHWNDRFSSHSRLGTLIAPHVDPLSGEPEFKFTPARVRPLFMAWYGILMAREDLAPERITGLDYWARIRGENHWRLDMAGGEAQVHWAPWAKRLLGAVRPDVDWLEFTDTRTGCYRLACLDGEQRLEACLILAPAPELLPARDWLGSLFSQIIDDRLRSSLLAGRAPGGKDPGTIVCACHAVGQKTIIEAISKQGLTSMTALGEKLRAGTGCGACQPELRRLINDYGQADSMLVAG